MDFEYAFTFPFKDPAWWKKLGLAALLLLVPVAGFLVIFGWSLRIARHVIQAAEQPLIDLQLVEDLKLGFLGTFIILIYSLPFIGILAALGIVAQSAPVLENANAKEIAFLLEVCCLGPFALLYWLALWFILPAALGNFTAHNRFEAGFQLRRIFRFVRSAPGAYFVVFIGMLPIIFLIPMGLFACGIGILATTTYSIIVTGHLYGQAHRQAERNSGRLFPASMEIQQEP